MSDILARYQYVDVQYTYCVCMAILYICFRSPAQTLARSLAGTLQPVPERLLGVAAAPGE